MSDRYVIARHCAGGIGDHLSYLVGSWGIAKRTGRTLVIDWRGSRFNTDPTLGRDCFADYFVVPQTIAGIKIVADGRVSSLNYPTP
jgi:hypothetical protein